MLRKMFHLASRMSAISRYSQTHLIKTESVLEHTGFVAILAYIIANHCEADVGKVLKKAIVHDIDEIITGDIPRTTKYANKNIRDAISEIENLNMKEISNELSYDSELYENWKNAKDDSLEGKIIKICDILSVLQKIHLEVVMYSNKTIFDHIFNIEIALDNYIQNEDNEQLIEILKEAKNIIEEIKNAN